MNAILYVSAGRIQAAHIPLVQSLADMCHARLWVMGCRDNSDLEMPENVQMVPWPDAPDIQQNSSKAAQMLALWIKQAEMPVIGVFAGHTPHHLRVMSILAAALKVPFLSNLQPEYLTEYVRSICAGRVLESISGPPRAFAATLSMHGKCLHKTRDFLQIAGDLRANAMSAQFSIPKLLHHEPFESDDIRLDNARLVFAGGRGLGSKENFEKMRICAKKYGAAVGASRLAVDLGWCRNDYQVGQTGSSVSPEIYVAFGISGAIQHLSGMKHACRIIAINTDRDAPIFAYADEGIVADANRVIEALI